MPVVLRDTPDDCNQIIDSRNIKKNNTGCCRASPSCSLVGNYKNTVPAIPCGHGQGLITQSASPLEARGWGWTGCAEVKGEWDVPATLMSPLSWYTAGIRMSCLSRTQSHTHSQTYSHTQSAETPKGYSPPVGLLPRCIVHSNKLPPGSLCKARLISVPHYVRPFLHFCLQCLLLLQLLACLFCRVE